MGYRSKLIRRILTESSRLRDGPAYLLLALGVGVLRWGGKRRTERIPWLPSCVTLCFRRFGSVPVSLNPSDCTHHQILLEFLEGAYDLGKVPFLPAVIVDCGAHIGLFLRLCRHHYPHVPLIAFEPQPRNAIFSHRAGPTKWLTLYEAAVGLEDGRVFFDDEAFAGYGSVSSSEEGRALRPVQQISLPRILNSLGDQPLLLKMDIEGAEWDLLPAIIPLLPQKCAVFVETHQGEEGWTRAVALFQAQGFKAERDRTFRACVDGFFLRSARAGQLFAGTIQLRV